MEKSKGLRELLKDEHFSKEPLKVSDLYNFLKDIHKDLVGQDLTGYPKHHTWEDRGQVYSTWEIRPGMCTGDAGFELYTKALRKYAESVGTRSSKRTKKKS